MASIDAASRLAAIIQAQYRSPARRAGPQASATQDVEAAGNAEEPGAATDPARLQRTVLLQAQALSSDDPQRPRRAFRLFLEAVLAQTFGRDRLGERGLAQLADSVLERMESDTQLEASIREAGERLLSAVAEPPPGSAQS